MKEKILFWIDIEFVYFIIAKYMAQKSDFDAYAVIDVNEKAKEFFNNQNLVDFKKKWYFLDHVYMSDDSPDLEYLEKSEEKFKINYWNRAYSEKSFYMYNEYYNFNSNEILSLLEKETRFYEQILDEVNPDFVIIKKTDWHHNQLFYDVCRAKGIKILMMIPTRLGFRVIISQRADKLDNTLIETQTPLKNKKELEETLKNYNSFEQVNKFRKNFQVYNSNKFIDTVRFFSNPFDNSYQKRYSNWKRSKSKIILKNLISGIQSKRREKFLEEISIKEINNESFVYFPLQFEPERTLLVDAPFYTDQLEVIRQIAKSVPIDYKLYVKEHPIMKLKGWRDIQYYRNINNLPNVELIHPSVNPKEIYEKCSLVITGTGTSSFEATFFAKPSIVFGDVIYSELSNVTRCKSYEELPELINKSICKEVNIDSLKEFIKKIEIDSFEMDINKLNTDFSKFCYYGGFLVDEKIPQDKILKFMEDNDDTFDKLANEHLKKISLFNDGKIVMYED